MKLLPVQNYQKKLDVKNMFQYDLPVLLYKFKKGKLSVNYNLYFISTKKISNYLTRVSETN